MNRKLVPAQEMRTEIIVVNSRFIATVAPVFSITEAKAFIKRMRAEYSDATHNVPAYVIGHVSSTVTHCSDAGEPSGTAGRPVLAVLQRSGLGDVAVVVTRYFGGKKLGKGGLVRAYGEAVRAVLDILPRAEKVTVHLAMIAVPYGWYERLKFIIDHHQGQILGVDFAVDVTVTAQFALDLFNAFQKALSEASQGSIEALIVETRQVIVPIDAVE